MAKFILILVLLASAKMTIAAPQNLNSSPKISPAEMREVVKNITVAFEKFYLYPENTRLIAENLHAILHTEHLQERYNREEFKKEIRASLIKSTHDTSIDLTEVSQIDRLSNHGGIKIEISDANIGYLSITGDFYFKGASEAIDNVMMSMSDVDALIIDLRLADKVELSLVQRLLSYFLPTDTTIGHLRVNTQESSLLTLTVSSKVKFKDNLPLYVLNSSFVAGEWEFFSYALQSYEKATVVGERTMGLSHFTETINVGNNIILELPYAMITHPNSDDSWDDHGVSPNYQVKSHEAMHKAYALVRKQLTDIQ